MAMVLRDAPLSALIFSVCSTNQTAMLPMARQFTEQKPELGGRIPAKVSLRDRARVTAGWRTT
jgi:hypothetical protein